MNTIIDQQHTRPGLIFNLCIFCALIISLFSATNGIAASHEHEIQVDFSFDTLAITGKQVIGYRLYKESEPACDTTLPESQSISCRGVGEDGTYNFTLAEL